MKYHNHKLQTTPWHHEERLVTIHFSACNFTIVYLYKEIKFKLKIGCPIQNFRKMMKYLKV